MIIYVAWILIALLAGAGIASVVDERRSKSVALFFSLVAVLLSIGILVNSLLAGSVTLSEQYSYYISQFNLSIGFQLNGVSLALLLMASIVSFVTILSGNPERANEKAANVLTLLFEFSAIGLFASANLFIFFIFWDIGVVALFFMIYLLGSSNRRTAAMKFLVYEILASMSLLFAIMLVYFYTPVHSFDISYIIANATLIPASVQVLIFIAFFFAFLVNMPVFPVHLWLPDAHTEASTQGSMLLSGILTKFGGYGMILVFIMMPIAHTYSLAVAALAGFSAFYAAFVLMTQHDIKRIVAYTTIVEMSIILVGIASLTTIGIAGATFAMLAHGFTISMLFLAAGSIGFMFADRDIRSVKGVVKSTLSTAYTLLAGIFATTGVPLTAAFIGDVLIFIGSIRAFSIYGALPLVSLILLGAYLYYVINKSVLSAKEQSKSVEYIGRQQKLGYALLLISIFFFGIAPFVILNLFSL